MANHKKHRMGYLVGDKKFEKIQFDKVVELCRKDGIEVVKIDIEKDLEEQGPFCLVLHRVSDLQGQVKEGNEVAAAKMSKLKNFLSAHPETQVVDPLSKVRKLCNRYKMYKMIRAKMAQEDIQVPPFIRLSKEEFAKRDDMLKKIRKGGLCFPLLAKPVLAHIHDLMLVYNENGLRSLKNLRFPLVLQNYVAHDGILWKIYVAGASVDITARPSIRNLKSKPIKDAEAFHSHSVSKPQAHSPLNNKKVSTTTQLLTDAQLTKKQPEMAKVRAIAHRLTESTDLTMIGIDLILESYTRRHLVIDINYFPGYDDVEKVPEKLYDNIMTGMQKHKRYLPPPPHLRTQHKDPPSTASEVTDASATEFLIPPLRLVQ